MSIVRHTLSFASGEWSPWLDGRTDLDKYTSACLEATNFILLPQGAAQKRPGMEFLGFIHEGATTGRIFEFEISGTDKAMLIIGGNKIAVWIDGAPALDGDDDPILIDCPWADDELTLLRCRQVNSVMYFAHPNHHPYQLTRYAANDWDFQAIPYDKKPPLLPENTNQDHRLTVDFQINSGATIWSNLSVNYKPGDRVLSSAKHWVCRYAHTSSSSKQPGTPSATTTVTIPGRPIQTITVPLWDEAYVDESSVEGQSVSLTATRNTWTADHIGSIFEIAKKRLSNNYNVWVKAASSGIDYSPILIVQGPWSFVTFGTWQGYFALERSTDRGVTWEEVRRFSSTKDNETNRSVEGEEEERVLMRVKWDRDGQTGSLGSDPRGELSVTDSKIRGLVKITAVTDARTATAVTITSVEKCETSFWSEGAWSDYQGWPRVLALHQARLCFAGTQLRPHTIWGSGVDDYPNFYVGTDADEAFAHTVAIGERDPILWMESERELLIGTGSGEWAMAGEDQDKPITPEFGIAKRQSGFGSHDGGQPAVFSDAVHLFVQRGGTRVREFAFRFESDRYEAANLNLLADHIFEAPIDDIAVQRMPWQIVWFLSAGKLFGLTFERSQGIAGWHRHETNGSIVSIGTIRGAGVEDEVWFLVDRGNDLLCVERFKFDHMVNRPDDGWWMDSAVSVPSPLDPSRYDHLVGKMAVGWSSGAFYGPNEVIEDEWPFVSSFTVTGLPDMIVGSGGLSGNPNGRYIPQGIRNGLPWFKHEFYDEGFFIQNTYGDDVWEWHMAGDYVLAANSYLTEVWEVDFWEQRLPESIELPTIVPDGTQPTKFPRRIDIGGELFPDVTGRLLLALIDSDTSRPIYTSSGLPTSSIYPLVELKWSQEDERWELLYQTGMATLAWYSYDDVDSPNFATTWVEGNGLGIPTVTGTLPPDAVIGLPFASSLMPMTPQVDLANGSSRSREMRLHEVVVSVRDARGGKFGQPGMPLDPMGVGTENPETGEFARVMNSTTSTKANIRIVSDEAFPFSVRNIAVKFNVYGDA